ncbi:MAG: sigma-70 family RNA polymerase sigma factor [Pirellulaceae bacterium]|nr:sigma-70 family RNA polymerase sigma factor [Pirellulaceae bacterium]
MASGNIANPNDRTEEYLRLLGEHDRNIYVYILALVPHWSDADDLAQETRLRLWQQFDKYLPGSDFGAWARSIAFYLVLAHREKAARNRLRFGQAFYDSIAAEFESSPNLPVLRQEALVICMEKLDQARLSLLRQYYSGQHTLREISESMGRSYDATRKALYRSQRTLADCIEAELRRKESEK